MLQSSRQSYVTHSTLTKSARAGHAKKHSNSGLNTWNIDEEEGEIIAQ